MYNYSGVIDLRRNIMDNIEITELLATLQERDKILKNKYNKLVDAGDNISAKGAKKQLQIIRKLIVKIKNSEDIIFDGLVKKEDKKSDELDIHMQKDILLDLARSLLKELKNGELDKNSSIWNDFVFQVENKIREIEKME